MSALKDKLCKHCGHFYSSRKFKKHLYDLYYYRTHRVSGQLEMSLLQGDDLMGNAPKNN